MSSGGRCQREEFALLSPNAAVGSPNRKTEEAVSERQAAKPERIRSPSASQIRVFFSITTSDLQDIRKYCSRSGDSGRWARLQGSGAGKLGGQPRHPLSNHGPSPAIAVRRVGFSVRVAEAVQASYCRKHLLFRVLSSEMSERLDQRNSVVVQVQQVRNVLFGSTPHYRVDLHGRQIG